MTITEIKQANKAAGFYFFERATMRFFDSRIASRVYTGPGGVYFITSEQFHWSNGYSEPRKYTVRSFDPATGNVKTHGKFNEIRFLSDAVAEAKNAAKFGKAL